MDNKPANNALCDKHMYDYIYKKDQELVKIPDSHFPKPVYLPKNLKFHHNNKMSYIPKNCVRSHILQGKEDIYVYLEQLLLFCYAANDRRPTLARRSVILSVHCVLEPLSNKDSTYYLSDATANLMAKRAIPEDSLLRFKSDQYHERPQVLMLNDSETDGWKAKDWWQPIATSRSSLEEAKKNIYFTLATEYDPQIKDIKKQHIPITTTNTPDLICDPKYTLWYTPGDFAPLEDYINKMQPKIKH